MLVTTRRRTDKEKQKRKTNSLDVGLHGRHVVFMNLCFLFKILEKDQASVCLHIKWGTAMSICWSTVLVHKGGPQALCDLETDWRVSWPPLGLVTPQGHPYGSIWSQTTSDQHACCKWPPGFRALHQ